MPRHIEPRPVLETRAFDDERIAIPVADRIAHDARIGIFGKLAAVEENLAIAEILYEDHQDTGSLNFSISGANRLALGPCGRHPNCDGSSRLNVAARFLKRASAQGWTSSGFRSVAMLPMYGPGFMPHRPLKSGLPSGVRGADAERLGLPSGVRGMPGVARLGHCADRAAHKENNKNPAFTGAAFLLVSSIFSQNRDRRNHGGPWASTTSCFIGIFRISCVTSRQTLHNLPVKLPKEP
jgi:hypothetical protein